MAATRQRPMELTRFRRQSPLCCHHSGSVLPFVVHRAEVTEGRVPTMKVVEGTDVVVDCRPGFVVGRPRAAADELRLQGGEEAFRHRCPSGRLLSADHEAAAGARVSRVRESSSSLGERYPGCRVAVGSGVARKLVRPIGLEPITFGSGAY